MTQAWDFVDANILWGRASILSAEIEELMLGTRPYNCLRHYQIIENGNWSEAPIKTVGDLVSARASDLLCLPNFGRKSLKEVEEVLAEHGLRLRDG